VGAAAGHAHTHHGLGDAAAHQEVAQAVTVEEHCRWLSHRFFVAGMDAEDVQQEALLAAWLADPGYEKRKATQRVYDLMKIGQRRKFVPTENIAHLAEAQVTDYDARDRLRSVLDAVQTPAEREALGRRIAGVPIYESSLWFAWAGLRDRVAA
jgi:DNA-directed RNA polymerase specialized sigma24 family protein